MGCELDMGENTGSAEGGGRQMTENMGTQQTGARHPCSPFTQHQVPPGPLCRACGLSFPPTHGPHLRLCLGIPCFGLLQDFFKGHFHISPHGPFHTGEKHTGCHEAGPCCLSGSGGDYNNGLRPRAACQNPGQTQTEYASMLPSSDADSPRTWTAKPLQKGAAQSSRKDEDEGAQTPVPPSPPNSDLLELGSRKILGLWHEKPLT